MLTDWLKKEIPQNLLLQKPWVAFVAVTVFGFLFTFIYTPFATGVEEGRIFIGKLIVYGLLVGGAVFSVTAWFIHPFIRKNYSFWTIQKELLSFVIVLFAMGLTIYFGAFLLEPTADRWNLFTFLDSFKYAVFICFLPYFFFSLIHATFWFSTLPIQEEFFRRIPLEKSIDEPIVNISSKLKKESLDFYLSELLCVSSEGNYVVFYLFQEGKLQKKIIRNSMNEIEEQLKIHECLLRVHRAFLVNLKKITHKKGNSLGYHLRLNGLDLGIPVSRNKVKQFEEKFSQFR